MPDKVSRKSKFTNLGVLAVTCVVTFTAAEFLLRTRYTEAHRPPSPEVLSIQPYVDLDPAVGFKWRPNVSAAEDIVFEVADTEHIPLSTDANGFINEPAAIAQRAESDPVDIVGLGDSFIEHASRTFYNYFQAQGLTYYNLAMQRQAPPQYNINLESRALPLKPKWILYGIFENDFMEAQDFENWQRSGMDWFSFHSGTWCGTPLLSTRAERMRDRVVPGFAGLLDRVRVRIRGERMSVAGPSDEEVALMSRSIQEALMIAKGEDVKLLMVFIPSRPSSVDGSSAEADAYDALIESLANSEAHVLDLRVPFRQHEDPASLYYTIDGHWNAEGMQFAAELILSKIRNSKLEN